ncbi:MAG: hypothetical protein ACJA1Z_003593 [Patiriisocius sp.]|jgi:hypothetical protein
MDKLTRYNQKLLAIIGTTVIVAAGLALIIGLGGLIISLIDFSNSDDNGIRIQNPTATTNDTAEFVRTQEVSFNAPFQLDTAQTKFLITVGQVNLKTDEKIRFESGSGLKYSSNEYRYHSYYGLFNNFVYLDHSKNLSRKLFEEQVAITHWAFLKNDTIEVLLFKGTSTDDNSDNQMDSEDYQSLFAYYLNDSQLKKYDFEDKTVLNFDPMNKTDLVSIELGIDKDKDFDFERTSEPQVISALNIRTRKIEPIITDDIKNEIQSIIDGTKK